METLILGLSGELDLKSVPFLEPASWLRNARRWAEMDWVGRRVQMYISSNHADQDADIQPSAGLLLSL